MTKTEVTAISSALTKASAAAWERGFYAKAEGFAVESMQVRYEWKVRTGQDILVSPTTVVEVCISIETDTEVFDHAHYSNDPGLCSMNLRTLQRHLFHHTDPLCPISASSEYDSLCDIADYQKATLHIRVNRCPYESDLGVPDAR